MSSELDDEKRRHCLKLWVFAGYGRMFWKEFSFFNRSYLLFIIEPMTSVIFKKQTINIINEVGNTVL